MAEVEVWRTLVAANAFGDFTFPLKPSFKLSFIPRHWLRFRPDDARLLSKVLAQSN